MRPRQVGETGFTSERAPPQSGFSVRVHVSKNVRARPTRPAIVRMINRAFTCFLHDHGTSNSSDLSTRCSSDLSRGPKSWTHDRQTVSMISGWVRVPLRYFYRPRSVSSHRKLIENHIVWILLCPTDRERKTNSQVNTDFVSSSDVGKACI